MDVRCGKKGDPDGNRVGQRRVGRFVRGSGQEIWHSYGGGFERRWK